MAEFMKNHSRKKNKTILHEIRKQDKNKKIAENHLNKWNIAKENNKTGIAVKTKACSFNLAHSIIPVDEKKAVTPKTRRTLPRVLDAI